MASTIYDNDHDKDLSAKDKNHTEQDRDFFSEHPDLKELQEKDDFDQWEKELADKPRELDSDELSQAEVDDDSEYIDDESQKIYAQTESRDYFNSNIKKRSGSGGVFNKRNFAIFGGGSLILSIVVGFFMFMTIYRSEHIRNLLWDYRFARFHRQVGKRVQANLVSAEGLTAESEVKVQKFEKTSMYEKIRGYSPEKAFSALGENGIKVGVEKNGVPGFRKQNITSFTDPETGRTVYSERASKIPPGSEILDTAKFADRLTSVSVEALDSTNHSRFFQKQTRKLLRDKVGVKFGDRFKSYQEKKAAKLKGEDRQLTEEEKRSALIEADTETAMGNKSPPGADGSIKEAAEAAVEDIADGTEPPKPTDLKPPIAGEIKKPPSKTVQALSAGTSAYAEFSTIVFAVTMGCILRDVNHSLNDALTTRIEAPMRAVANVMGEAEQIKNNDNVDLEAVSLRNSQLSNVEQSAAFQVMGGADEASLAESSKLEVADLPFQVFGVDIGTLASVSTVIDTILTKIATQLLVPIPGISFIPGTDSIGEQGLNVVCSQALNPKVQLGLAVVDAIALIASLGTTGAAEGFTKAAIEGLKQAVTIAGSVGLMKIIFEYGLPKFLFAMAGEGGILHDGDPNNGNKLDLGAALLSSEQGKMAGATTITDAQAMRDQEETMLALKKQRIKQDGFWAYIDPSSPYSITGQLAMSMPGTASQVPKALFQKTIASTLSLKPIKMLGSMISPKAKAQSGSFITYGIPQKGIPDSMLGVDMIDNALIVEGDDGTNLAKVVDKYSFCFTDTVSQQAMSGFTGKDYSVCNDEMAQRLGLYNVDLCSNTIISNSTDANNCSVFAGAGDVTDAAGATTDTSNAGTVGDFVAGTMPPLVTTDGKPCPASPTISEYTGAPNGVVTAQRGAQSLQIKLCVVHGYLINKDMATNFDRMYTDMKAAGYTFKPGGNFRTNAQQADMFARSPGSAAPPGRSNHELGLAVDQNCSNADGTQEYKPWMAGKDRGLPAFQKAITEHPCLNWLHLNSKAYGLLLQCDGKSANGGEIGAKTGGCETWHLSPTGG